MPPEYLNARVFESSFWSSCRVLYFSIHRHEHGAEWPNLDEAEYTFIGEGAGRGYNVNVPLNVVSKTQEPLHI